MLRWLQTLTAFHDHLFISKAWAPSNDRENSNRTSSNLQDSDNKNPSQSKPAQMPFFNWITSCCFPTIHGSTRAAPPPPASGMPRYCEDSSSAAPMKQSIVTSNEFECCPICLTEFTGGTGVVKVLPRCGHAFHKECIDEWLPSRSLNCPVCRDQVVDERLTGKPVGDEVLLDPAAALALNFSSMHLRCLIN